MPFVESVLRPGDSGLGVDTLERHLIRAGYELTNRFGSFNEEVEAAVRDFQSKQGLSVDGTVGPNTQARFFSVNQYSGTGSEQGEGVKELQAALNRFTIPCGIDGIMVLKLLRL